MQGPSLDAEDLEDLDEAPENVHLRTSLDLRRRYGADAGRVFPTRS
jgi:hypothetical protein